MQDLLSFIVRRLGWRALHLILPLSIIALSVAGCVAIVYYTSRPADSLLCPSAYTTTEEATASFQAFTNNFYDAHPDASLSDLAAARHDFYVSHHCTQELAAYQQAVDGNADPATMKMIDQAIGKVLTAIKDAESKRPPGIGASPSEKEIYENPYIKHIRTALHGYLDGTNDGVEVDSLALGTQNERCGLEHFDKSYYRSKFVIYSAENNEYGGVEANIIFIDKPNAVFWAWVYQYGGDENGDKKYALRGFCEQKLPAEHKAELLKTMSEFAHESKYSI